MTDHLTHAEPAAADAPDASSPRADEHRAERHRASEGRWRRMRGPLIFAGALAGCTAAISLADPSSSGVYPPCPTKLLTGLDCPACGGLRATYALAHGHLGQAADRNLLFFLAVPLIGIAFALALVSGWRGEPTRISAWAQRHGRALTRAGLVAIVAFTVLRNIPGVPYLSSDLG